MSKTTAPVENPRVVFQVITLLLSLQKLVHGDIYMHMPRGSNNRLNEASRSRNNPNRLFDSQNNNRGGYNVGSTYYYQGSTVTFEWTNQHSCADPNNNCEIIIQYMCHDKLRDGSVVGTIPLNPAQCAGFDCTTDYQFGMHEDLEYYLRCQSTVRGRVFSSNNIYTNSVIRSYQWKGVRNAQHTRQNPRGIRFGYECPEERDYYPYWNPSQWRDIAVLTNDASRCPYYQQESQNVKKRGYCSLPAPLYYWFKQCERIQSGTYFRLITRMPDPGMYPAPTTQEACEQIVYNHTAFYEFLNSAGFIYRISRCASIVIPDDPTRDNSSKSLQAEWVVVEPHNIAPPVCRESPWSRDNHLGNGKGGFPNTFNWTVPDDLEANSCAFRIRYNISSNDYNSWNVTQADDQLESLTFGFATPAEARKRGFNFQNKPVVYVFNTTNLPLRLAVNTAQYGRTFQDRSHVFSVKKRPDNIPPLTRIHNVQVRGKRGNIVQTYPSVEYDYVPNSLSVSNGDYVHFQWTGSNNNPRRDAGQGLAGSDRHNIVLLRPASYKEGVANRSGDVFGQLGENQPAPVTANTILGFSRAEAERLALLQTSANQRGSLDSELDDAGVYFDMGLKLVSRLGLYHYMCTRNNNFSNRSQKGKIVVHQEAKVAETIGSTGGTISLQRASISLQAQALTAASVVTVSTFTPTECQDYLSRMGSGVFRGGTILTDCVLVEPEDMLLQRQMTITLNMTRNSAFTRLSKVQVFATVVKHGAQEWSQAGGSSVDFGQQIVSFPALHGGLYVAQSTSSVPIVSIIFVVCITIVIILAAAVYMMQKPESRFYGFPKAVQRRVNYVLYSFRSQV